MDEILQLDQMFMGRALTLATQAWDEGEVPVGALVVLNGTIIGEGWNRPIGSHDPSAHAEIQALRAAGIAVGNYRLVDCELYVTLEPCVMCSGAIMHARIKRVIYGAPDAKTGACGGVVNLFAEGRLNHHAQVISMVRHEECVDLLKRFFRQRRQQKKLT